MKSLLAIGLLLALGGCATPACDTTGDGTECRSQRLLYQNDLMQAKILVTSGYAEGYPLAHALLDRIEQEDRRGEVELYRALLLKREDAAPGETLAWLEKAAAKHHPHAVALMYKVYAEPLLGATRDLDKAAHYRQAYGQLDVAISGYPSFEQALEVAERLLNPSPLSAGVDSGLR